MLIKSLLIVYNSLNLLTNKNKQIKFIKLWFSLRVEEGYAGTW